jgi:phospholipid/cholesterol/gamma-HCH transport system substrate-binding protein
MDERTKAYHVGIMFFFTLLATGILLVMFGKLPKYAGSYPVKVRFEQAGGMAVGTPVRKSGILIGRVGSIELTDNDQHVLASLEIENGKGIYLDETCFISRDLLGDTAVVFRMVQKSKRPHQPIPPDAILDGEIPDDPTGLKTALAEPIKKVTDTGEALTEASKKFGDAADRICKILDEKSQRDVQNILGDAAESLRSIKLLLGDKDKQAKLTASLDKLPQTLDAMNRTFASTDAAIRKFTDPTGPDHLSPIDRMTETIQLAQKTMKDFNEPSAPGKLSPAEEMKKVVSNVEEFTTILQNLVARIDRGDGTLGALLNDRELYNRLNRTMRNMEEITRDVKPIISNLEIATDKIARNPGVVVRGAINPGSGVKGDSALGPGSRSNANEYSNEYSTRRE